MNIESKALWGVLGSAFGVHRFVYEKSGGLIGHRIPGLPRMLLLDHVGAKSGTKRTTPLVYIPDGDAYVVIASKGGHPRNPAWFHNLRANPDTEIRAGTKRVPVRARVATAAEHKRLWPRAVKAYRGYRGYQERTDRKIPVVILEPR